MSVSLHFAASQGPAIASPPVRHMGAVLGDDCVQPARSSPGDKADGVWEKREACWEAQSGLQWRDLVSVHTDLTHGLCVCMCGVICQSLGAATDFYLGQYTESVLYSLCNHLGCCLDK